MSGLRQNLRVPFVLLLLALLAVVSGCGSVAAESTAEATGGTVADPTGSIKGQTITGLVDAYTGNWSGLNGTSSATTTQVGTAKAQWQHAVLLSDHTGACGREGSGGGYAGNEVTVRLTMIGFADLTSPPATPGSIATIPSTPLTFTANVWQPPLSTPGEHRMINPYYMKTRSHGRATPTPRPPAEPSPSPRWMRPRTPGRMTCTSAPTTSPGRSSHPGAERWPVPSPTLT